MKNKKINLIVLLLALSLVFYFTLKDDFLGIISQFGRIRVFILLFAIFVFLLSLVFKSLSLKTFINQYKKDYSLKKSLELTLIGQFLNGITPFQSGGQPFQIYLLKKDDVRITDSGNIMIKDFISYQIPLILIGALCLFLNTKVKIISNDGYLNNLIFLGFAVNLVVLFFLLIIPLSESIGVKIVNKIIDFIFKFKITNKLRITKDNLKQGAIHFYESSKELKDDKKTFFNALFFNTLYLVLLYLVPYFIFRAFGCDDITPLGSIIATSFVMLIGNFIPIPGATGGIEYSFLQFFGYFCVDPILSGAMLIWRGVTYFLGMIMGFIILLFKKEVKEK